MTEGMPVMAGTWHGSQEMIHQLRMINVVDLNQTAQDLLPGDPTATLTLALTAMMQMLGVPCQETRGSMTERDTVTETEIRNATEKETGTVTGIVIDGLITVAMIALE